MHFKPKFDYNKDQGIPYQEWLYKYDGSYSSCYDYHKVYKDSRKPRRFNSLSKEEKEIILFVYNNMLDFPLPVEEEDLKDVWIWPSGYSLSRNEREFFYN